MCTNAIVYLIWSQKFLVMAYLDDIVASLNNAERSFLTLTHLLQHLGLPVNEKKVQPPSHKITCIGIEIDARSGTLSIPIDKLQKIKNMCYHWLYKDLATRYQVQR